MTLENGIMDKGGQSEANQPEKSGCWKNLSIALIIFLIALIVRYVGLKFGFPLLTHPDETYLMGPLIRMSLNHTLDPSTYIYPALPSFYSKHFVMKLLSQMEFGKPYSAVYWMDPFLFFFVSRLMTAIQGALLPVVAWFIGRKFKQVNFSWIAAVLFTFYPPFVLHSHYVTVDIPLTLYVMLVLLFSLNYISSKKNLWLVLACAMVSIAALEKYPGILSFGIIITSIAIRAFSKDEQGKSLGWRFFFKTIAWSLSISILAILVIAPSLFMNFETAWNQIVNEARPTHLGSDGLGWGGNLLYYLKDFYQNAGLIISLIAAVGLAAIIMIKDPVYLLLFFGGGYWIALSYLSLHHSRWSLPMMTTPLFLAAIGVSFLWQQTKHQKFARIALSVILLAGFVPFVLRGTVTSVMLTWSDTRNEALHYMEENNISNENTISEGYTPHNPNNKTDIYDFDIFEPGEKEYVVLSSLMFDRYQAEPDRYLVENAFYKQVRSNLVLIKQFQPDPVPNSVIDQLKTILEYLNRQLVNSNSQYLTGPKLEIYKLPD